MEVGLRALEWASPMDIIGNAINADILRKAIRESVDVISAPIVAVITEVNNMTRDEFMDVVYDELYSDGDNDRANRIIDAADSYAEECKPDWISVREGLPEENYLDDGYVEPSQPVLVYMSYHYYKVSRYWGHRRTKGTSDYMIPDWMDLEDHDGDNVLAWMPLPAPPKEAHE